MAGLLDNIWNDIGGLFGNGPQPAMASAPSGAPGNLIPMSSPPMPAPAAMPAAPPIPVPTPRPQSPVMASSIPANAPRMPAANATMPSMPGTLPSDSVTAPFNPPSGATMWNAGARQRMSWPELMMLAGATMKDVGSMGRTNNIATTMGAIDKTQRDAMARQISARLAAAFANVGKTGPNGAPQNVDVKALIPLLMQANAYGVDTSGYVPLLKLAQGPGRILSQDEAKALGFRPGAIVKQTPDGYSVLQSSDVMSPQAFEQKVGLENANPNLAIARGNLKIAQDRLDMEKDPFGMNGASEPWNNPPATPNTGRQPINNLNLAPTGNAPPWAMKW